VSWRINEPVRPGQSAATALRPDSSGRPARKIPESRLLNAIRSSAPSSVKSPCDEGGPLVGRVMSFLKRVGSLRRRVGVQVQ